MKSTAPAFIARTLAGMSPCPVMKTIDTGCWRSASAACNCNPVSPGILISSTRQPGRLRGGCFKKSTPDAKLATS